MQKVALLVDDSRVARITLKRLLVASEFNVIEFESGDDAIHYLEQEQPLPDIIFMDVMMPGMDGVTATDIIKHNPKTADIPVVMCTGNETAKDMEHGLSTGAIAILSKPPAEGELQQILTMFENANKAELIDVEVQQSAEIDEQAMIKRISDTVISSLQLDVQSQLNGLAEKINGSIDKQAVEQLISQSLSTQLDIALTNFKNELESSFDHKLTILTESVDKRRVENSLSDKHEVNSQIKVLEHSLTQELTTLIAGINSVSEEQVKQIVDHSLQSLENDNKFAALNAKLRKQNLLIAAVGLLAMGALAGGILF